MKKTIKEVQSLVGLSRSQIQRFENAGLCTKPTEKNKYGHLLYDDAATQRLMLLRYYHDLGYSIPQMHTLLTQSYDKEKSAVSHALACRQQMLEQMLHDVYVQREMLETGITPAFVNKFLPEEYSMPYSIAFTCIDNVFRVMSYDMQDSFFVAEMLSDAFLEQLTDALDALFSLCRQNPTDNPDVLAQMQRVHTILSEPLSDALLIFFICMQLIVPGSELSADIDNIFGSDAARLFYEAGQHYMAQFYENNPFCDRNFISAMEGAILLYQKGYAPEHAEVQLNIRHIDHFFAQIRILSPEGRLLLLKKMVELFDASDIGASDDGGSSKAMALFFRTAIELYLKKLQGE